MQGGVQAGGNDSARHDTQAYSTNVRWSTITLQQSEPKLRYGGGPGQELLGLQTVLQESGFNSLEAEVKIPLQATGSPELSDRPRKVGSSRPDPSDIPCTWGGECSSNFEEHRNRQHPAFHSSEEAGTLLLV